MELAGTDMVATKPRSSSVSPRYQSLFSPDFHRQNGVRLRLPIIELQKTEMAGTVSASRSKYQNSRLY